MPRQIESPRVGLNEEFIIPTQEEGSSARQLGGELVPKFKANKGVIPAVGDFPRNTEGIKKDVPLQTSRRGERRI
jgi:hypothetical protein